ncbi:alpha/beta fold hydrolase [Streptomyces sp. NPDC000594]|uniref:alpha/beta fold hydrolase n=1 Tax=Streptomyces sp. NPDC000594 TaxID=3154261 RepID=UPI00332A58D9
MTTFALIPGADGRARYWHRVVPELTARGHRAVTMDLPDDPAAGLGTHAETVVAAVGPPPYPGGLVLVAQSLAGFHAPLVAERLPVDGIVLLNAMVPEPGETAGEWWENTGQPAARRAFAAEQGRDPEAPFDPRSDFFHDVPEEIAEQALAEPPGGGPSDALFLDPWPLLAWPDVPTRVLQGRDDRFFPLTFQRRVARDRLGLPVEALPGGHLLALSRPAELAERLG